jgi:hypothetical protein
MSRHEPPLGLDTLEAAVMASNAPAVLILDRALMRDLLRYLRAVEAEAAAAGSFW